VSEASRRFTREESALILRRATDAERRPSGELDAGLTLDELVAAAREAGIDPAAVRRAAALERAPVSAGRGWALGAPAAPELRARLEGCLEPDARRAFQDAVERAFGRRGAVTVEKSGALVWSEEHGLGRTSVRVETQGPSSLVTATADRRGHLLALVLGLAGLIALLLVPLGGFAGLARLIGPLAALVSPIGVLALGTRALWPALQRPVERRLEHAVLAVGALLAKPR
jgi:hypothetical protein